MFLGCFFFLSSMVICDCTIVHIINMDYEEQELKRTFEIIGLMDPYAFASHGIKVCALQILFVRSLYHCITGSF